MRLRGIHRDTRWPVIVVIDVWDLERVKAMLERFDYGEWEEIW